MKLILAQTIVGASGTVVNVIIVQDV